MNALVSRAFDLRRGEGRSVFQAFVALFLVIAAHTALETARDAIFLAKLPPRQLNIVYVILAALTLVVTGASVRAALRFGRRNTFIFTLVLAAYVTTLLHSFAMTQAVALSLYVFSGLLGAVLVPQFWLLAGQMFTVAQGRRLFGPIASGGVLGAVTGAGAAALVVRSFPVTTLLPFSAAMFLAGAAFLTTVRVEASAEQVPAAETAPVAQEAVGRFRLFRDNPFLLSVAALVCVSTAAVLVVDYSFKAMAARFVAPEALGAFFARYYAVMNAASLVVQTLVAGRVVRRAGVIGALAVMPFLLLAGGVAARIGSGIFLVVLVLKAVDGALRHSLNRVAIELLYLPLPAAVRDRGKSFIDGSAARITQAVTALVLYALATRSLASARVLAVLVIVLSAAWLAIAIGQRRPYLDLFRRALAAGSIGPGSDIPELDLRSAEALVETLASPDPAIVVASMAVLEQHRHTKLVPALVLLHESDAVLLHALEAFGRSARRDWVPLAERLLKDPREEVRIGALRALGRAGVDSALEAGLRDASSRVQAYAAFSRARNESQGDLLEYPLVAAAMKADGEYGKGSRHGLLAAVSDAPDDRAVSLLLAFAACEDLDEEDVELLARAIGELKDPRFIPACITRLSRRVGREAIRDALVAIGDPALDALERALADGSLGRSLRQHLPQSISSFGTQRAADVLVAEIERETDGVVRYKALRALGQMVARVEVRVDRRRVEAMALKNLEEHVRLVSLRVALAAGDGAPASGTGATLLEGLLADKQRQSLERAFRLLKIAHKREDIHRVHTAALSADKRARAHAGEFLDVLLARRDQGPLRAILRLVVDDASDAERVARAVEEGRALPRTRAEALAALVDDRDDAVAALATHCASAATEPALHAAVSRARARRPTMRELEVRLFRRRALEAEVAGG